MNCISFGFFCRFNHLGINVRECRHVTFDNMLLIKEKPGYAMLEPVPLRDTVRPPAIPDKVDLKRKDGTVDELYDYWMLGGASRPREPRWSIIRNVLGWVD